MPVRIQAEDFDVAAELAALTAGRDDIGAVVTFSGLVRGGDVTAMTLEHYPGMTEKALEKIEAEANTRWPLKATLILHRTGRLMPGDRIVLVVAAAETRHAAFEAASFLMDYLKTDAPLWKNEEHTDGTSVWVDARDTDSSAKARWSNVRPLSEKPSTVSVRELVQNFAEACRSLASHMANALVPWRDGQQYDNWDRVAEALFETLVLEPCVYAAKQTTGAMRIRTARYGFAGPFDPRDSAIHVIESGHESCLIGLTSMQQPFDSVAHGAKGWTTPLEDAEFVFVFVDETGDRHSLQLIDLRAE